MEKYTIIKKKYDCIVRNIAGEHFLVPIHDSSADMEDIFYVNETGQDIWNIINRNQVISIEEICNEVSTLYNIDSEILFNDIKDFILELLNKNLVVNVK